MRASKIAAKIRNGQAVRIAHLGYFIPPFIAYAAHEGYDGIWLELEHRAFDPHEVQALISYCHLYDIDCLVRPATRERAALYRFLEDGATGLIMPHVPDVETAVQLVQAVKFPPLGDRGIEGNSFETNFGLDLGGVRQRLIDHDLRETLLIIQIETPQAASQLEGFAALAGVDALYIGPSDMSVRLPQGSTLDAIYQRTHEVCQHYGKAWGSMPRTPDDIRMLRYAGATLHVWGTDFRLLRESLQRTAAELDEVLGHDR